MNRTALAALAAGLTLGLPSAAWYVAGSRAVEQESARLAQAAVDQARGSAASLAQVVAGRLESLRRSESRRPYTDYHGHDGSAAGDCACEPQPRSPLAEGPTDPLVWLHFEIDEVGRLVLPTLAGDAERAMLEQLECAGSGPLGSTPRPATSGRTLRLESEGHDWVVTVGPFTWRTLELDHGPALVASRQVVTPAAVLTQGFVVRARELDELVAANEAPATIRPGRPTRATAALLLIGDEPWTVDSDDSREFASATAQAERVRRGFRWTFALGLVAVALGGSLTVGLVWQAERLARQRQRFAATAAHELRTPLAGLRLYGEMLAGGLGDPARERDYARRIAGEAERLGRTVSNLLGFSRLERGALRLNVSPGDLERTVRESIERLKPAVEAGGGTVQLSVRGAIGECRFDPDAVHHILQNLLDNAVKHGGRAAARTIEVVLEPRSTGSRLSVVDGGPGVTAVVRRRLFRPFVSDPTPGAPAGLGLGLALVRALARAQGATVAYEPFDRGGSCFSVNFRTRG